MEREWRVITNGYSFFLGWRKWFEISGVNCCCSATQSCPTLCDPMDCSTQASLFFTISWSLLKLISIKSVMLSNNLILCCPLLLLPSIFPSIRVFSNELACTIRWPKYWSFSVSASNEYSRLIFLRIDWFDLLAVQGSLKSLLQHHIVIHQCQFPSCDKCTTATSNVNNRRDRGKCVWELSAAFP